MFVVAAAEPTRTSGVVVSTAEPHVCAPIDANGNLTSDGTKTYFWNALNQLVEVKEGTTTIAAFEYDGKGRRTEKVAAGLTHQYIYDAEDIVEERITGSSTDTIRYFHGAGIDEPLARKNSSDVVTYDLADHLGSIVQETSAGGAVILEREYGPWGDLLSGASTAGYAFQGREWDAEIALYYFRARYYNASSGAWTADDPIGFSGGFNFARFVNNNPLRFVDPLGLCSSDEQQRDNSKETNEEKYLRWKQVLEVLEVLSKVGTVVAAAMSGAGEVAVAEEGMALWPAASGGRTVINGIEYSVHALERMQPVGTIIEDGALFSRGVPPSVVENAIRYGRVTAGNTAAEVVRTFENVRVITNAAGTRVISVIKTGS